MMPAAMTTNEEVHAQPPTNVRSGHRSARARRKKRRQKTASRQQADGTRTNSTPSGSFADNYMQSARDIGDAIQCVIDDVTGYVLHSSAHQRSTKVHTARRVCGLWPTPSCHCTPTNCRSICLQSLRLNRAMLSSCQAI